MQKSKGFTLVELVIVIVILGILAVTAAPKFLDLTGDAKRATVNGVKAALQSANTIIYSKAVLAGVQKEDSATVAVDGGNVAVVYGYVDATSAAVEAVLDLDEAFTVAAGVAGLGGMAATDVMVYVGETAPDANSTTADVCLFFYTKAANATSKPTYTMLDAGC